jgi:hypothetical protein
MGRGETVVEVRLVFPDGAGGKRIVGREGKNPGILKLYRPEKAKEFPLRVEGQNRDFVGFDPEGLGDKGHGCLHPFFRGGNGGEPGLELVAEITDLHGELLH